jgi:ABC-2 type transport system ATP-binding protein
MNIIEAKNLVKKFGKFTALNKVDLEVSEGEVFGFIGPNGAGKTTTIRTILGILKATSGSAKVFGRDAWKDAVEIHKRIAYVPGDVNLWSNLTGGEVIDLFVQLRGAHNPKRREELIKRFELDPTKKCGTYSKGNRQKVALVAALASDVDLYILDEPTSGLDPLMEQVFRDEIKKLKEAKKTVFLSSHILQQVELLCDRIGIIKEGKIVQVGVVSEMKKLAQKDQGLEELFMKHYEKGSEAK